MSARAGVGDRQRHVNGFFVDLVGYAARSSGRGIEALVHEIRINQQGEIIPVFKIPGPRGIVLDDATPASTTGSRNGAVGGPDDAECKNDHHGGRQPVAGRFGQVTAPVTGRSASSLECIDAEPNCC